ncbi:MAG: sugar phosphate isomerase/epimerase [Candidatus Latescibacteria bacterium]|nr:sugar phosphate isomerase/epimerase [Candidatus Latescibacterota bacterium]
MHVGMRIPPMGREMGLPGIIQWAAENGLGSIDLPEVDSKIRKLCDQAGLGIGTVDWGAGGGVLSKDAGVRRKAVTAFKQRIRAVGKFGSGVIFLCLSPDVRTQPRDETFEVFKKVYPGIMKEAEKHNVNLAIEPWPGPPPVYPNLGCTPETLRAIFDAVPSPNLGICYDPSHFARIGVDYKRLLREFGDRVRHVHAKDTELLEDGLYEFGSLGQTFGRRYSHGEGWWRYCIPGWGVVDWQWVVARLEEVGYDGPLSIELEDHRFGGDKNAAGILAAKTYLESVLG